MRTLNYSKVQSQIVVWLDNYLTKSNQKGFVVGVSGGVDSAVVSTLCAKTGKPLLVISMPINQAKDQVSRANKHIEWLREKYPNVNYLTKDLTDEYIKLMCKLNFANYPMEFPEERTQLAEANIRSRLRMTALYYYAGLYQYLVAGTGNKVEDYGVGFFTKYGDGGVDISPIGDLMKSEVRKLAAHMGILPEIAQAVATDGLWDNGATDEDQIGATYDELEWAMEYADDNINDIRLGIHYTFNLTERQKQVFEIYKRRHFANAHKMNMPPICEIINCE